MRSVIASQMSRVVRLVRTMRDKKLIQYKGIWWMPREKWPKKDVVGCDKPRGVAKQTLIRGSPN